MAASKTASNRQNGIHQLDEQRERILDTAEKLFLLNGIDKIRMIDIAIEAEITKIPFTATFRIWMRLPFKFTAACHRKS